MFCSRAVSTILNLIPLPQLAGNFSIVITYFDVQSDQISALYYFFWGGGGGGLGPYFSAKRLDYCLSSILSFTSKYREPPLERSLSLRWLVFLRTTLKRNFSRRKISDPGFERNLLVTFFL